MKRRRVFLIWVACLVVVAGLSLAALWPSNPEPVYKGRKLSSWLTEFYLVDTPDQECFQAVHRIGTNSIPCLLKWIDYDPGAWRDKALVSYAKVPSFFQPRFLTGWLQGRAPMIQSGLATMGFEMLGPEGAPAVSDLIRLLQTSKSNFRKERLMLCLGAIGSKARPALPLLRTLARSTDVNISRTATLTIGRIMTDASELMMNPIR